VPQLVLGRRQKTRVVKLTQKQIDGLDVALNEATLLGLEVDPQRLLAAATFSVLTLPLDGPSPVDRRRQFLFRPVGRIAASLRLGRWDDPGAPIEAFSIAQLLSVIQSFGGQPIYGWKFIDREDGFSSWSGRLSLDFVGDPAAIEHSITLFQEGTTQNKILDICLWFRELEIRDAQGEHIPVDEFIAGGTRWWDALYAGDSRTKGYGIVPAKA
jgi:hypothetical protein